MFCLGNKMAADKIASKESERTEIHKPWITFCACRWDAPTHSKPDPSKVTRFCIKPSSTDTAVICYNFPCQKINWLRLTLNSSKICTNLLKGLSTSRKLLISPVPSFRFLQKPETKQDFLCFQFGAEVLQALTTTPQGDIGRQTQKGKSLKQVIKEGKDSGKTNKNQKLSWNCKVINNRFTLKCFHGIMALRRYAFLDTFYCYKLGIFRRNAKPV